MNGIIEKTESICPVCKRIIVADIVDKKGSAYMVKECVEHGRFENIISKYSWYYKGLNFLYDALFPQGHLLGANTFRNLIIHPTSRCNLNCSICYSSSLGKIYKEPELSEIRQIVSTLEGRKIITILGGEPTMREDIFEIVRIFRDAGHYVEFFTNGVKLKKEEYLKGLKKSGVNIIHINLSSLRDNQVYAKMGMGNQLFESRQAVVANLKKMKVNTGIIDVVIPGLTDKYVGEIAEFSRKNRFIYELSVRGYSYLGKLGFPRSNELTMDELVEIFSAETKQLITLEEFYIFQKIIYILRYIFDNKPQCYVNQHIFLPRKGKKIRDILPPDKMDKYIQSFTEMVKDYPFKAKIFFLSKLIPRMAAFGRGLSIQSMSGKKFSFFSGRYYIPLEFCLFYTPYTLDLRRAERRCSSAWWHSYAKGEFNGYCKILASISST